MGKPNWLIAFAVARDLPVYVGTTATTRSAKELPGTSLILIERGWVRDRPKVARTDRPTTSVSYILSVGRRAR